VFRFTVVLLCNVSLTIYEVLQRSSATFCVLFLTESIPFSQEINDSSTVEAMEEAPIKI